jgi:hypothetical protein
LEPAGAVGRVAGVLYSKPGQCAVHPKSADLARPLPVYSGR